MVDGLAMPVLRLFRPFVGREKLYLSMTARNGSRKRTRRAPSGDLVTRTALDVFFFFLLGQLLPSPA